jgi:hypothetical protein
MSPLLLPLTFKIQLLYMYTEISSSLVIALLFTFQNKRLTAYFSLLFSVVNQYM